MNDSPSVEAVRNSYRDAAAMLMAMLRDDADTVKGIVDSNEDAGALVSGMTAIAAMIAMKAAGGPAQAAGVVQTLVDFLASIPEEQWKVIAENSVML